MAMVFNFNREKLFGYLQLQALSKARRWIDDLKRAHIKKYFPRYFDLKYKADFLLDRECLELEGNEREELLKLEEEFESKNKFPSFIIDYSDKINALWGPSQSGNVPIEEFAFIEKLREMCE
jgi:hypothetical protein